jgi:hypothetical protein
VTPPLKQNLLLAALAALAVMTVHAQTPPEIKMTTDIPPEIIWSD